MSETDQIFVTRFAPSPTGRLHLGHALAAARVFESVNSQGGESVKSQDGENQNGVALLRIEDIDHTRCHPEFIDGIYEDLSWLGFDWLPLIRVQSQHYSEYAKVIIELMQRGLAYPCYLSRKDLKAGKRTPHDEILAHGKTAKLCNKIHTSTGFKTPSLPFAVRLNLKSALKRTADPLLYEDNGVKTTARIGLEEWVQSDRPDPIIARRDIAVSYHIAVTHDDQLQGVSHIIRGADFIEQTPLHVLIQTLMRWPTPTYSHHPLITDETGRKLSKSAKDLTIQSLRESGKSPDEVLSLALSLSSPSPA